MRAQSSISRICGDGAVAGFKYFEMGEAKEISVELAGQASGKMLVSERKDFSIANAKISVENQEKGKQRFHGNLKIGSGKKRCFLNTVAKEQ